MNLETEIYQILKKHKLTLKKREEVIVDLLVLIKADQAEQLNLSSVSNRRELLIDLLDKLEKGGGNRFVSKEWIVDNYLQRIR